MLIYICTYLTVFAIIFSSLISDDFISLKKNITSLLNTTNIVEFNESIVVSTQGGLYSYDDVNFISLNSELNQFNISCLAVDDEYLWIGNKGNGIIQILDDDLEYYLSIEYPSFDEILDITFSENYAFVIVSSDQTEIIIQYSIENTDSPHYLNTISSFPLTFETINDIIVFNEILYVATNNGLMSVNYNEDNILFSSSWNISFKGNNIPSLLINQNTLLFSHENNIFALSNFNEPYISLTSAEELIHSMFNTSDNDIIILSDNLLYMYSNEIIEEINIPNEMGNNVVSFLEYNNKFYYGINNFGILIHDQSENNWSNYIPNTIYKNQFNALALTREGHLVGVANHLNDSGQSGGFIFSNPLSLHQNNEVNNFYSYNGYYINKYPLTESDFNASILSYWSGANTIHSAVINDNNELYFSNSGNYGPFHSSHFESIAETYSFTLSDDILYGGVVELGINTNNYSFTINDVWNLEDDNLGGLNGIYDPNAHNHYITVNQIIKDKDDNIWVVNPYSEKLDGDGYHNSISIKHNNGIWYHIKDDEKTYLPIEISLDKDNNVWISYQFSETIDNSSIYSPGGIHIFEYNNIKDEEDDRWHKDELDELEELNIWSLVISKDNNDNQILWILNDYGVKGYILDPHYTEGTQTIFDIDFEEINNDYYFDDLTYEQGCKLRVDYQNNVWITTKNNGLRIIKNNGQLFSNNLGEITTKQLGILSDNIYDVIFDEYGNVYIATEYGISILETSFDKDFSSKHISVSPNPFIIGENTEIILSNVSRESTVKIMNLSGLVVKEFNLDDYGQSISWDGKSDKGYNLGTGVYLVSVFDKDRGIGSTKLAVINK